MSIPPRRLEILGVAGTGKSTLACALADDVPTCRVADSLHTRLPAHWPYVAHGLPRVLPLLLRTGRRRPVLSWEEVKYVLYVAEWSRFLNARPEHRAGLTVLDQGPLFGLARLLWGGKPATRSPQFQRWLARMVAHWSEELDLVVWLDASEDVLVERINFREQRHEAKGQVRERALELLQRHRDAYGRVLDEVQRVGRLPIRRLDTSTTSPQELALQLGRVLEETERLTDRVGILNVR